MPTRELPEDTEAWPASGGPNYRAWRKIARWHQTMLRISRFCEDDSAAEIHLKMLALAASQAVSALLLDS